MVNEEQERCGVFRENKTNDTLKRIKFQLPGQSRVTEHYTEFEPSDVEDFSDITDINTLN